MCQERGVERGSEYSHVKEPICKALGFFEITITFEPNPDHNLVRGPKGMCLFRIFRGSKNMERTMRICKTDNQLLPEEGEKYATYG